VEGGKRKKKAISLFFKIGLSRLNPIFLDLSKLPHSSQKFILAEFGLNWLNPILFFRTGSTQNNRGKKGFHQGLL